MANYLSLSQERALALRAAKRTRAPEAEGPRGFQLFLSRPINEWYNFQKWWFNMVANEDSEFNPGKLLFDHLTWWFYMDLMGIEWWF